MNFFREAVGHSFQFEHESLQHQHEIESTCRAWRNHVADVSVVRTPRVVHGQCARDAVSSDQTGVGGIVPRLFRQHQKHSVFGHGSEHELQRDERQPQCHWHVELDFLNWGNKSYAKVKSIQFSWLTYENINEHYGESNKCNICTAIQDSIRRCKVNHEQFEDEHIGHEQD